MDRRKFIKAAGIISILFPVAPPLLEEELKERHRAEAEPAPPVIIRLYDVYDNLIAEQVTTECIKPAALGTTELKLDMLAIRTGYAGYLETDFGGCCTVSLPVVRSCFASFKLSNVMFLDDLHITTGQQIVGNMAASI